MKAAAVDWALKRRQQILEAGVLRSVECPRCGAAVAEDCRSPLWYVYERGHQERRQAAGLC